MINSYCSHCGLFLSVQEEFAGGRGICPRCEASLRIPRPFSPRQASHPTRLRYLARPAQSGVPAGEPQIVEEVFGPSSRYRCSECGAVYESLKLGRKARPNQCPSCQHRNKPTIEAVEFPRQIEVPDESFGSTDVDSKEQADAPSRREGLTEADWERMRQEVERDIRETAERQAREAAERYVREASDEAQRLRDEAAAIARSVEQAEARADSALKARDELQEQLELSEQEKQDRQAAEQSTRKELERLRTESAEAARRAEEADRIRHERERFQEDRQKLEDERRKMMASAQEEIQRERHARQEAQSAFEKLYEEMERLRAEHRALRESLSKPRDETPATEERTTPADRQGLPEDAETDHATPSGDYEATTQEGLAEAVSATETPDHQSAVETADIPPGQQQPWDEGDLTDELPLTEDGGMGVDQPNDFDDEADFSAPRVAADADWAEVGAVTVPELGGLSQSQQDDFLFIPDSIDPYENINRIIQRGSDARADQDELEKGSARNEDGTLDDLPMGVEESHLALDAVDEEDQDHQVNTLGQRCEWYYSLHGEHGGPVTTDELRQKLRSEAWDKHGLVRHRDSTLWEPADEHPEFQSEAIAAALSGGGMAAVEHTWLGGVTKNLSVLMFGFILVAILMLAVGGMQFTFGQGHDEVFEVVNWLLAGLTLVLVGFGGWLLEKNQPFFDYLPKGMRVMALVGIWGLVACGVCFVALAVLT